MLGQAVAGLGQEAVAGLGHTGAGLPQSGAGLPRFGAELEQAGLAQADARIPLDDLEDCRKAIAWKKILSSSWKATLESSSWKVTLESSSWKVSLESSSSCYFQPQFHHPKPFYPILHILPLDF